MNLYHVCLARLTDVDTEHLDEWMERAAREFDALVRIHETGSVIGLVAEFRLALEPIRVAVTVYRKYGRVRMEVLTPVATAEQADRLLGFVAGALELSILDRTNAETRALVAAAQPQPEVARSRVKVVTTINGRRTENTFDSGLDFGDLD